MEKLLNSSIKERGQAVVSRGTSISSLNSGNALAGAIVKALILFALLMPDPAIAAADRAGFSGVEFYGSSQLSRVELDKFLRLKPGATYESGEKAFLRLQEELAKKNVKAHTEIVPGEGGNYYISVDVVDSGINSTLPNRRLENAHHINLKNEKPFGLLAELRARLTKVQQEGRAATENYQQGIRYYSDIPATRIAERIMQEMEGQEGGIYRILSTDPNGERRADAVELLNWTAPYVANCAQLIPALDDSDVRVRSAAAKYLWSHIADLPNDFPFDALAEGLSHQLARPSHHDRLRAMYALVALAKRDSDSITAIKSYDEVKLKEIANSSVIPDIQKLAEMLVKGISNPPPLKKRVHGGALDTSPEY